MDSSSEDRFCEPFTVDEIVYRDPRTTDYTNGRLVCRKMIEVLEDYIENIDGSTCLSTPSRQRWDLPPLDDIELWQWTKSVRRY